MGSLIARNGHRAPFTLLADGKPRWGSFGAGFGIEFMFILIVVGAPMVMPQRLESVRHYWFTPIYSPPVVAWKPQPIKPVVEKKPVPIQKPKPIVAMKPKPEIIVPPPKPKIVAPVFTAPVARPATGRRNTSKPDVPEVAKAFPDARPNTSFGSSAIPTLKKPREQVQTGGFGDPNGLPATGNPNKAANIAKLGSYDLPPGPGYGNGTGGARGARGVVASAGFGNGVAVGGSGGSTGGQGGVKQGVFVDQRPSNETAKVRNTASSTPRTEPVEILFKPKPVYTDLARQKLIEGEVLAEVVFSSTGDVRVLRVIRGLGYGLDEAAVAAARQIRFRPARQDGQPVDSTATVHILFELAY
jgi:TonB family protein